MKKIICSLLVVFCMVLPVICESWADSKSLKAADDYDKLAQEAFDKGDYALALELSQQAEVKRSEVEVVINERMVAAEIDSEKREEARKIAEANARAKKEAEARKSAEAQNNIALAENQLQWAKNAKGDVYYPMTYSAGEQAIENAKIAYKDGEYDSASFYAKEAISVLAEISDTTPLPQYYIVRPWDETKDCYWNISARSYVYNNPTLWENLYNANKANMEDPSNPDLIHPGMKIEIPSIAGEVRSGTYDSSITYDTFSIK
ncbi:MAG: hypothetical protein K5930_07415 [Treponemataceae bacterium]|nr:hypothetical protein [Treponemataceae bacterium]